ncbi:MAG TPA: hypothetical protein VIY90_18075 [Steroidobacteraceae bacterium]
MRRPESSGAWALAALLCFICVDAPASDTAASQPVPRLADGHPDLNGTWDDGAGIDFIHPQKSANGTICISGCDAATPRPPAAANAAARPAPNVPKYKPQFLAKVADLNKRQVAADPVLRCKSPGLPRIGPPAKIIQTPGQVVFLYSDVSGAFYRIIPTDGRPHRTDVDDSYLGDSVGHWEGDTLVIEANQFNDDSWLTDNGAFHTTDLRVTERLRRVGDVLEYQVEADDPSVLAEPWRPAMKIVKRAAAELAEPAPCIDRDLKHLVDDTHHPNPR